MRIVFLEDGSHEMQGLVFSENNKKWNVVSYKFALHFYSLAFKGRLKTKMEVVINHLSEPYNYRLIHS